jgi:DNA-binding winged helix-turn-helix (wHTH) protein
VTSLDAPGDGRAPAGEAFVTGDWRVEPSRNLLVGGDRQVRLEPRVMDVLVRLAASPGAVVPKDELVRAVWAGRYVGDDVLAAAVYALRKALADDARQPRYVETVPRRGYRWLAPVARCPAAAGPTAPRPEPRRRGRWPATAAPALALVVAGALWMTSRSGPRHRPTPEAQEAYAKGRYFLDQRSVAGLQNALDSFERAIALDPGYPAAHAGVADTYSSMSDLGVASPAELRPRAMAEAQRALDLDPGSAQGHAALGRARLLFDWDFAGAERSLARAIEIDGDYMPAQQAMGWLQSARGRPREAIAAARRALQLDPVNVARYLELAWVLALDGQYAAGLAEAERARQLGPRSPEAHFTKGWVHELAGRPDAAYAAYREALRIRGAPEDVLRRLDGAYRAEGLAGYYRSWLGRAEGGGVSHTWRAQLHLRAGEPERALAALEQAYERRESALAWVNVLPAFSSLRSQARFRRIAVRVAGGN